MTDQSSLTPFSRALPHAQLAVLPGTDHMKVTARTEWLLPAISAFLDAPAAK